METKEVLSQYDSSQTEANILSGLDELHLFSNLLNKKCF